MHGSSRRGGRRGAGVAVGRVAVHTDSMYAITTHGTVPVYGWARAGRSLGARAAGADTRQSVTEARRCAPTHDGSPRTVI